MVSFNATCRPWWARCAIGGPWQRHISAGVILALGLTGCGARSLSPQAAMPEQATEHRTSYVDHAVRPIGHQVVDSEVETAAAESDVVTADAVRMDEAEGVTTASVAIAADTGEVEGPRLFVERSSGLEECPCPPAGCLRETLEDFPDEYLCDGGDRGHPVHYTGDQMAGLETEDTVVEFTDSSGKRRVKPSNSVCVYAPRFAAVTTVSGVNEDVAMDKIVGASVVLRGGNLRNRQAIVDAEQKDSAGRIVTRLRGSMVTTKTQRNEMHLPVKIITHEQTIIALNDLAFLQTGTLAQSDEARLALGIQAAFTWTRVQYPVMSAEAHGLGQIKARFQTNEMTGIDPEARPGKIRIVKLADRQTAKTGDEITFTIRYDNLGDLAVSNVVISDNLTPRLEYVPDSATSDRNGALEVFDNDEGSVILRWVLDGAVSGGKGGVVTFKARVK